MTAEGKIAGEWAERLWSNHWTFEELEDNLRDAYRLMVMDDVPDSYEIKEIAL
jgi:hypothetical protein